MKLPAAWWPLLSFMIATGAPVARVAPAAAQPARRPPGPKPPACLAPTKRCSATCVAADVAHGCGSPDCHPCAMSQAGVSKSVCIAGPGASTRCGYDRCLDGWRDDDGEPANGCEAMIVASFDVTPRGRYQVTRQQVPGGDQVDYELTMTGNDIHYLTPGATPVQSASATLLVPAALEPPIRDCLAAPFSSLVLVGLPGQIGLLLGPALDVGGIPLGNAFRPVAVRVVCTRTFPAPPSP
jgi:hypothetical protein